MFRDYLEESSTWDESVVATVFLFTASSLLATTAYAQTAGLSSDKYALACGARIYYDVKGTGAPVVLIHGGQLDRRMWDDQFDVLADKYTTIRYDVRGYGKSPDINKPYSNVGDLEALLTHLKVETAHIVGLSMGGKIAIDFAIAHPGRVLSLTLAGPGLSGYEVADPDSDDERIKCVAKKCGPKMAADLWLKTPYMAPAMRNENLAPRLRTLTRENAHSWPRDDLEGPEIDAVNQLCRIDKPTLLILGSCDVKYIKCCVEKLRNGIPRVQYHEVKGAGHMVSMEKPKEFNILLLDFLKNAKTAKSD